MGTGIDKKRLIICLLIWWVAIVILYGFVSSKQKNIKTQIVKNGVISLNEIAGKSGLYLLERDIKTLADIIDKATKQPDIIYVSILDHKNKIIAYNDHDQVLPKKGDDIAVKDSVWYWAGHTSSGEKAIFFSKDITFAGTRIGEIFIAFSAEKISRLKIVFTLAAIISLLLIASVLITIDLKGPGFVVNAIGELLRKKDTEPIGAYEGYGIECPMCGTKKQLSKEFIPVKTLDKFMLVRPAYNEDGSVDMFSCKGVMLDEIVRKDELGWLRRRMIYRCAEIIRKLAGDQR